MSQIHVSPNIPRLRNLVSQFDITAILLELHILPVPVRTIIGTAHNTREPSFPDTIGNLRLQRVIRTVPRVSMCPDSILLHLPGNNINHSPHRVRTVQHGCRSPQHFYTFRQQRLVSIGDRVSHQPHVLRMSVNQHEHPRLWRTPDSP